MLVSLAFLAVLSTSTSVGELARGSVRLSTVGAPIGTDKMWWGEPMKSVLQVEDYLYATSQVSQTTLRRLVEVGAENDTTIVFPVPLDLISPLLAWVSPNGKAKPEEPIAVMS